MRPALNDGRRDWSAAELDAAVHDAAQQLRAAGTRVLATLLDNGPAFVALDEAAAKAGVLHLPLPPFFTPAQHRHALQAAGVDTLVAAPLLAACWPEAEWVDVELAGQALRQLRLHAGKDAPPVLPPGTVKLTYTSGSTGTPKGVCLDDTALNAVAAGLVQALAPLGIERHLNALPFSVLLENVAGLMAARRQGATLLAWPLHSFGLKGSSSFDATVFHAAVQALQPHSLILLPQMLRAWCAHLAHSGQRAPASLKIVAVGGAAVGAPLVALAQRLGIPACEGYGLSEGGSVQTLNLPGAQRAGSVGRVLPHARLRVADDGELLLAGSLFSGYLGDTAPIPAWWPTGDLGRIDDEGYVHIHGRKREVLITSYGRNVSPEWVETALRSEPEVLQAVVFGDAQPTLSAVLWPTWPEIDDASLQAAIDRANRALPDYARVARWTRGCAAFDAATGLATTNGRPQRAAILRAHADLLSTLAETTP